jgi:hypothetical protein
MRVGIRRFLVLTAVALSGSITLAAPAQALPASCAFKPVYPTRISIGQSVTSRSIGLAVNDPACRTLSYDVLTNLVRGTDEYFGFWSESEPTDTLTLFDSQIRPGTYVTQGGTANASDLDYNPVPASFVNSSTIIKFAGRVALAGSRSSSNRVTLTATSRKWTPFHDYLTTPYKYVDFQRYVPATSAHKAYWGTIRRAMTNSRGTYSFYFYLARRYSYRVLLEESSVAFGSASGSLYR